MGRVIVTAIVSNYDDVSAQRRDPTAPAPRTIEIEALVDSGATMLCIKRSVIDQLGLTLIDSVSIHTANGLRTVGKFSPVWLELIGRASTFNVLEVGEETPNLIGQIPLEELDFLIDSKKQRLVSNPAHGGVQGAEIY